jgi:ATP-dependent helicase HrpB
MLEPRRIAARAAARRMAEEAGEKVGDRIGYTVRFDDKTSKRTTLRVVTSGIFLRQLQDDPFLDGVGIVVLDEFHERSIDADLALAMTRRVQTDARADLRIVVMSATLETKRLAGFLGNPTVIESEGRLYPIETHQLAANEGPERGGVDAALVSKYVRRAYDETGGNILVFLPGLGEIKRCARSLDAWSTERSVELFELYGDLPAARQDAVFRTGEPRKVVLATNIAETSLTIPGITAVVDTGLCRSLRYSPASGLDRLELGPISRSSARQRCGRAGRTAPGTCWQLWTAHDERSRPEDDTPEIQRVDLAAPALQLATWGETDLDAFGWFEAPPAAALVRARSLLEQLGAIERSSDGLWPTTALGKQLARLPLHPRLARLLVAGAAEGVPREAATCAALMSERSPFRRSNHHNARHAPARVSTHDSDIIDELEALGLFEQTGQRDFDLGALSSGSARNVLRVRDQIARVADARKTPKPKARDVDRDIAISRALLQAFPDRLASRRTGDENRAVMVGGRGVTLARECGVRSARLFLCLELDDRPGEALVRRASAIERQWLPADRLRDAVEYEFDAASERVEASQTTRFEGLVISTRPAKPERNARSADVLAAAARKAPDRALDLETPTFAAFSARASCVAEWMPELDLPEIDAALLDELLGELCDGRISFEELRKAPLLDALKARFTWEQLRAIDQHAPETIAVPSGSNVKLTYERGRPPILAARIQELFGWADGPTVAQGRVRVLLHLLAPSMRPQQVTDDLRNFWNTTYAEVRKELRVRYPKHDWPEDPWKASPSRGARRRRGKTG